MSLLVCICNRKRTREAENLSNNARQELQMDHRASITEMVMNDLVQPNASDFNLLACIGQGCYNSATISLARHMPNKKLLAIKRIHLEICEIDFNSIVHEIVMHQQLRHKNILESYCTFVHGNEVWLTLPLMGYGSCRDLLHAHFMTGIPELTIAFILREVLNGLDYLHKWNIIHRSVQASHILISANGNVCLSGLRHCYSMIVNGVIRPRIHDFPSNFAHSLQWASPELLEQNLAGYNTKSDIYSIGITACELANGVVPFADMPLTQMLLEKIEGTIPRLLDSPTQTQLTSFDDVISEGSSNLSGPCRASTGSIYYEMPASVRVLRNFSTSFHNFVKTCLQHSANRPSAEKLMQHNYFKQIRKRCCQYMLPELLRPVTPITDSTTIPDERIAVGGSIEALVPKLKWIDIDEWNFGAEMSMKPSRTKERFPLERSYSVNSNNVYDPLAEFDVERRPTDSSQSSTKSSQKTLPKSSPTMTAPPTVPASPKSSPKSSPKASPKSSPQVSQAVSSDTENGGN